METNRNDLEEKEITVTEDTEASETVTAADNADTAGDVDTEDVADVTETVENTDGETSEKVPLFKRILHKIGGAAKRRWDSEWHVPDVKKKGWRDRSIVQRLLFTIPALVMFIIFMVVLYQMSKSTDPAQPLTKEYIAVGIAVVSVLLGVFCVRLGKIWGWVVTAITPAACFLLVEYFYHNPFDIKEGLFRTNLALFYLAAAVILFVTGSLRWTVIIESTVTMLFGIANYYVMEFRGNPLFPWDFASVGTAADVADNYSFRVTGHVALIVCCFILLIQLGAMTTPKIRLKWWSIRVPAFILAALALTSTVSYIQSDIGVKELGMYPYLFTPKPVYTRNGAAVAFSYTLQFAEVEKPSGYSAGAVKDLLDDYVSDTVKGDEDLPNVIVIMNEAFSDLKTAIDYRENEEVTPYINSMVENTVKGTLHTSVKGGNTANAEFEFLTGLSMLNFTPGSIPYQQYLKGETPTFASQLKELGYTTVAMHPYGASGWKRDTVYPWFGFDEMYFSPDFKGYEKIRSYYSDRATYKKIIELYEDEARDDSPMFFFDVTMQNHSGYTDPGSFKPSVYAYGLAAQGVTNVYLSLMHESDKAFGELIEYFKTQDEKTVILMFGDHQPNDNVVTPLWKKDGVTVESGSLDEQLRRYTVPFVMWANYDIEEATDVHTSLNYMSSLMCETAGIPMTAAQKYLSALSEVYPVVTMGHYGDADGNYYDASTANDNEELKNYSIFSYNLVSDRENIFWDFFKY